MCLQESRGLETSWPVEPLQMVLRTTAPPGPESGQRPGSSVHAQTLDRRSRAPEAGGDSSPALFVQTDETD